MRESWQEIKLGEFMEFKNGINADKKAYGHGTKFINLMDIFKKPFLEEGDIEGYVEISSAQAIECSVQEGDILFNRTSETKEEIAFSSVYMGKEKITFGGFVIRGRQTKNILTALFAGYCFKNNQVRKELISKCQGAVRANIGQKELSQISIRVPPLPEQQKIAAILRTWDEAIEKTGALIAAKECQFDWLTARLINNQKHYLEKLGDHFGKSILIEKGKPIVKVDVADNGKIPVIAGGKTSPYNHNKYTHSIPCITVSASGAYAGYVWYHDYPIWASDCNVIYSKSHSTQYLYFAIKSRQSQIYAMQSGGGQPHIYASDLENISIPLPLITAQKRIADTLNIARQEIDLLKKSLEQYYAQKQGLMQKLLTGEWQVNKEEMLK